LAGFFFVFLENGVSDNRIVDWTFLWIGESAQYRERERKRGGKRSSGKSRPVEWRLVWCKEGKNKEKYGGKAAGKFVKKEAIHRRLQEEEFAEQTKQRREQS
jgi:hypothetical protein